MDNNSIQKYLRGESSETEKELLMQWIEASPDNRRTFMHYRRLYDAAIWSDHEIKTSTTPNRFHFIKRWMQVAAVVAVSVTGSLFIQQLTHREQLVAHSVEVPAGQRVNLTLSDGTRVTLNSNSELHFPSSFEGENREVSIDGEGFFEVAHDASRPFIVKAGNQTIRVLGTRFNVMAYHSTGLFETSLLEGSVQVENTITKQKLVLVPNERVSLKNDRLVKTTFEGNDDFLWRDGIYVFKNENLTGLFTKLEQYYQVDIQVNNSQLLTQHCTGKFRQKEGIEHILKVLQKTYNFNYTRNENANIIVIH
ncbi:MAG: FecR domain-containing protein [Paludibacter sp.]|jgi:ferric-dicitrate binding protein FerR (iron transport regulator)|nr:FecR domain-containing protein [Paludibacter sp.]